MKLSREDVIGGLDGSPKMWKKNDHHITKLGEGNNTSRSEITDHETKLRKLVTS